MNSTRFRHGFVYFLVIFAVAIIALGAFRNTDNADDWNLSNVADAASEGTIDSVVVSDNNRMRITLENGNTAIAFKDDSSTIQEQLAQLGVSQEQIAAIDWSVTPGTNLQTLASIGSFLIPLLIVLAIIYFMLRQSQGSNNQQVAFGKSRARMFSGENPTISFNDVAGCDEAKEELGEIVEFLKESGKFLQLGARIPKGVLLVGPPGTGKTLLAKAVSGEAGVPFFSISGSEFVEMFVGVGASRVRDLFEQAKKHSPCIIFIDEIDAVGRQRGAGLGGSHDEREQTLNQILVEMDGFDTDTNVIMLAATNRPDILDPALLRPGRFDRRVVIDRPDVRGREGILTVHMRGKPLAPGVSVIDLAKQTPGFVGADLENMVNEAAILAARRNKTIISMAEFQEAVERVIAGPERRSRLMSEGERQIIAYHEAGHAVVGHLLEYCDPVLKVTIIPRGMAGGYTLSLPEDVLLQSRKKFYDDIAMALGGRVAEEIVFGDITTGASNDIQRVTQQARAMVTQYGMSERLGPMMYGQRQEMVFLGRDLGEQRDYSDAIAEAIDNEVRLIVDTAYQRARETLTNYRDRLEAVAEALLEIETLEQDAFERLMRGESLEQVISQRLPRVSASRRSRTSDEESPPSMDIPPSPAPI